MTDAHKLCPHGICVGAPPIYGCGVPCDMCIIDQREHLRYTADAICGFPDKNPKNSKKTVRQVMRDEEEKFLCSACDTPLRGPYATFAGDMRSNAPQFHLECFPKLSSSAEFTGGQRRCRIWVISQPSKQIPAFDVKLDRRIVAGEAYGQVKSVLESHRDMLSLLRAIRQEIKTPIINYEQLDRVISRAENVAK